MMMRFKLHVSWYMYFQVEQPAGCLNETSYCQANKEAQYSTIDMNESKQWFRFKNILEDV